MLIISSAVCKTAPAGISQLNIYFINFNDAIPCLCSVFSLINLASRLVKTPTSGKYHCYNKKKRLPVRVDEFLNLKHEKLLF